MGPRYAVPIPCNARIFSKNRELGYHMSLDAHTVRRIARLARIGMEPSEAEALVPELNGILGWVEQLGEVNVDDVPPMIGTGLATPRLRADVVTDGDRREDILANAPDRAGAFYTVPKVVE